MSYPPGRPLQVPQMPPNLQPRPAFGAYPRMPGPPVGPMRMMTVGMMQRPMHPGMMQTMPPRPVMTHVTSSVTIATDQKPKLKITVFVGNISEKAPDGMIKQLLQKCGPVLNWKRVQGASGKLQAFGFCEYADPEAGLRAMRVLHDLKLAEKNLVVKVDAKTRTLLDEYLADKKTSETKEDGEAEEEEGLIDDEGLDDHAKKVDRAIQEQINLILQDHQAALNRQDDKDGDSKKKKQREEKKEESVDDMEIEEDKKNLIFREIDRFRDTYKADRDKEENKDKEKERRERKERERERERQREKDRERERERDKEREKKDKERKRERDRELEREREREVRGRSRDERDLRRERERDRERDREKERDYDEEEEYERRKFERKLREKEETYQERVKNWESRERKKKRENEKLKEMHADERIEQEKEAKRLKEFLEDYDDERDDPKYYRGSALERRKKEREKEMELDIKDRKREKEEIEDIKRKLLEEGREDVDEEIERLEKERDAHKVKQLHMVVMSPTATVEESKQDRVRMKPAFAPVQSVDNGDSATPESASPLKMEQETTSSGDEESEPAPARTQSKIGFGGLKLVGASSPTQSSVKKNKKMSLVEVFNQDDEDGSEVSRKRRKLIPIEYTEEEKQAVEMTKNVLTAEDKKKVIKTIIDKIPTSKEELFAYKVDWVIVDESLMERRIKPWINKKIVEYIGEEEPTLTEFICTKLLAHSPASSILQDITMVLDEEAEVFVVKMWRVLIYEVEAKKQGLVK